MAIACVSLLTKVCTHIHCVTMYYVKHWPHACCTNLLHIRNTVAFKMNSIFTWPNLFITVFVVYRATFNN